MTKNRDEQIRGILEKLNLDAQSLGISNSKRRPYVPLSQWKEQEDRLTNYALSQLSALDKIDEGKLREVIYKELLATAIMINEVSIRIGKPEYKPNYEDSRVLNLAYKRLHNVEYLAKALISQRSKWLN